MGKHPEHPQRFENIANILKPHEHDVLSPMYPSISLNKASLNKPKTMPLIKDNLI